MKAVTLGLAFGILGVGVGAVVAYLLFLRHGLEGPPGWRWWAWCATAYAVPALLVSVGGVALVGRTLALDHASHSAVLGGLSTLVMPLVIWLVLAHADAAQSQRRRAQFEFELARRGLFESVGEIRNLEMEHEGRHLTTRLVVRSAEAFALRARITILATGPGWSSARVCESTIDFTLVPGRDHVAEATCRADWVQVDPDWESLLGGAHAEARIDLRERVQDGSEVHLVSRSLRLPGLCPAPR